MLFACESGSRGWEFPSPDSDYDVRFIYARPFQSYLSVLERRDDLRFPVNDELDVYGWDIRKVLKLIRKSNTTPFEWLQSPIVYRQEQDFKNELWALCPHYFDAKTNIHHYLGIAKGALDTIVNEDEIKIKKLFYILRPLLSATWCLDKNSIAPMTFGPLMKLMPANLYNLVNDLVILKAGAEEGFIIKIDPRLKRYINKEFERVSAAATILEKRDFSVDELDAFFLKTIRHYDH